MGTAMLHILWDESHIWGLIAARAARAMRLPHRLVRAADVASGLLERARPSLFLVPGGNARHKAQRLGSKGLAAVRAYVEGGGCYFGFCGGAGLALVWREEDEGLGICAMRRGDFGERMQHFMSGHLHMIPAGADSPAAALVPPDLPPSPRLPVWWPGRFGPVSGPDVTVLASYERPADDFWLADLPIADLPADTFAAWQDMYGLSLTPGYLVGQPCLVYGGYGRGSYVLSYSHLETPDSPEANRWLAHLFSALGNLRPAVEALPPWKDGPPAWEDPLLARMDALFAEVRATGLRHGLLFERTDWLMAWRSGLPGASLNNLWAALRAVREKKPSSAALAFWRERGEAAVSAAALFAEGCVQYFLAERLAMTLTKSLPEALPPGMLKGQRDALFGPPMQAEGLYREMLDTLDELAFLQLSVPEAG